MKEVTFAEGEIQWSPTDNDKYKSEKPDFKTPIKPNFKPPESVKTIYTDGGSRILQTPDRKRYVGAWSFYDQNTGETFGEACDDSTNNMMELTAVIKAIEYLDKLGIPKDRWCTIVLDSDYVRFGILFWCKKWEANGWVKKDSYGNSQEIKNLDLWKKLNDLNKSRKIYYEKVAGHSGDEGNERVDIECRMLMDQFIKDNNIQIIRGGKQ
jgi:ribonuclease HI